MTDTENVAIDIDEGYQSPFPDQFPGEEPGYGPREEFVEDQGEGKPGSSKPDLEIERSILGAILSDPYEAVPLAMEAGLRSDDFFQRSHADIYATILELYNEGKAVDLTMLRTRLKQKNLLKLVGGVAYLSELDDHYGIPGNVGHYATIIIERSTLRRLMDASAQIATMSRSNPTNVAEVLDESEALIYRIRDSRSPNRLIHVSQEMDTVFKHIIEVRNTVGGITGIPTGYTALDQKLGGFQKTDLIIIGGRPGMGKTSLALNFTLNAAIPSLRQSRKDLPPHAVALFSMEMGNDQVLQRLLCQLGHHDLVELRTGRINDDDINRLTTNASLLRKSKIFIDDTAAMRPLELRAKARRLKSQLMNMGQDLGLIVVDYLQLMRPNEQHQNREQQIREISGSLKALAKELKVPVITLSQLKRSDELEPSLSDLRESGSIEQDADLVLFIVRPEMIKKDDITLKGKAEIRINKHRNGPTGVVYLQYLDRFTSFVPGTNFDEIKDI
ncbi:MAG: replicative DNA helicase [Deltaproteobacteria bacterium]|jgi:replicative DNA helicase|nr:replicative DNA helicase [Deltaproteobacteria bacterium]